MEGSVADLAPLLYNTLANDVASGLDRWPSGFIAGVLAIPRPNPGLPQGGDSIPVASINATYF